MGTPGLPVSDDDLTAKARIRNAAMRLFAEQGEDSTSMRAIAGAAGVTVGLLVHHYGTKDRIRAAVEELIVEHFSHAIDQVPVAGDAARFAASRDEAVRDMLAANPVIVDYLRRTILDPKRGHGLLVRLTDLTHREVVKVREGGVASTEKSESAQVVGVMVRQLGQLFLQPMVDVMWTHLSESGVPADEKPDLHVRLSR